MTIICCKDGEIAADSSVWVNDLTFGTMEKISKLSDGSLCAFSGNFTDCELARSWLQEWLDARTPVKHERPEYEGKDDSALGGLWLRDQGIFRIEGSSMPYLIEEPFAADGAHSEFAMGLMAMGASAGYAVEMVIKHGAWARGPVVVKRLEG